MTATKKQADKVARALLPHVKTLLLATAYAECERERVDKIQRRVLAEQNYYYGHLDPWCAGERCLEPKHTYLMDEHSSQAYFAKLNAIHLAEGFEDAAKGCCPALVAEHNKTQAEWVLIEAAEEFFPGADNNSLLCAGLEKRKKYLDLLIGLCVNHPAFDM